jgi:monofunctional glycosyltransferase
MSAPNGPPGHEERSWRSTLVKGLIVLALFPVVWVLALRFAPIPGTWLMVERALGGARIQRTPVALEAISPNLVRAVIASEDARFCAHHGFDLAAIERAFKNNERGRRLRGGSTISQQTAKNVFLWPARSWVRKGLETGFTGMMEIAWPKRRIMEAYLNVAEWGDGVFGAEAAARHHFGVSAGKLSAAQAARLAAILPNPRKWSPTRPNRRVARRAQGIQRGMNLVRESGLDTCAQAR